MRWAEVGGAAEGVMLLAEATFEDQGGHSSVTRKFHQAVQMVMFLSVCIYITYITKYTYYIYLYIYI